MKGGGHCVVFARGWHDLLVQINNGRSLDSCACFGWLSANSASTVVLGLHGSRCLLNKSRASTGQTALRAKARRVYNSLPTRVTSLPGWNNVAADAFVCEGSCTAQACVMVDQAFEYAMLSPKSSVRARGTVTLFVLWGLNTKRLQVRVYRWLQKVQIMSSGCT